MQKLIWIVVLLFPSYIFSQTSNEKKSAFFGQYRTHYTNTYNRGKLKDFRALAAGGKLKYQYNFNKKLQFGAALYNSSNLNIQDLTIPDPITGGLSRYEEGLYDRLNLNNDVVTLLGELYISYTLPKHKFKLGRMKINTPLINPQDGRMIPTLVQGVSYTYKVNKTNVFQAMFLNQIAPRSTGKFFGIGESIGTYPSGRNKFGQPSQYSGNTNSQYVALFNYYTHITNKISVDFWNQYIDNVSNTFYIKPTIRLKDKWNIQMEWLHQNKVGNGGNSIDSLRYFENSSSDIIGIKLHYKSNKYSISIGYDRILPGGQFISPREWGKENLFSFQKRERNEGSGDNHSLVVYLNTTFPLIKNKASIAAIFSLGRNWKPFALDATLNKYVVPDYTHLNLDFFFKIKKLKSFKPELLITTKLANGDLPDNPNVFFNKTDLVHIDVILNYNF